MIRLTWAPRVPTPLPFPAGFLTTGLTNLFLIWSRIRSLVQRMVVYTAVRSNCTDIDITPAATKENQVGSLSIYSTMGSGVGLVVNTVGRLIHPSY